MEKLPNIDHYRNILSIEGAIAARLTLSQLHEETPTQDDIEMGKDVSLIIIDYCKSIE